MTILALLLLLVAMGVAVYYLDKAPIDPSFVLLIRGVLILVGVFVILYAFGIIDMLRRPVPQLR